MTGSQVSENISDPPPRALQRMKHPATGFPETRASLLVKLQSDDDEAAWHDFVAIYRPIIYRMACRRGLQDADAQDLAQQVLLSVSGVIGSWQPRDGIPFRHWLRKVASNAILKTLTRQPKDARGGTTILQMLGNVQANEAQLQRELDLERQREIFLRAAKIVRADVDADTWKAFELAVIEGLPIEQAAQQTGKGVGAAYAARGRVMKRLKQVAAQMQEGGET